jgi:biopolymer transport protein ExbD
MWSICKKEFNQFFSNLTGYIAIVLFLLINGIFLFMLQDSSIFEYGFASLEKFFELAPWILLFLVPAITMRSLSEEFKTGTFEILQTKPLSSWQIVLGKYLSVLLVMLIFLMLTTTWSRLTEINMTLPLADAQQQKDRPQQIVLTVSAQGQYAVNKSPIDGTSVGALAAVLRPLASKEVSLVISADAQASHQSVVNAMEAARRSGLSKISFAAQSAEAPGS